ncbi:MAG: hypothetical protein F4056_08905, partial [Chloroflexi bacterium]|nr:hypothetical protein [Chloroflexota bacterium]
MTATDPGGLAGSLDVTVEVTDIEEAGVLTISPPRGWPGTRFDTTFSDDDGSVSGEAWLWERSTNRSSWEEIAGATTSYNTAGAHDVASSQPDRVDYAAGPGGNQSASG